MKPTTPEEGAIELVRRAKLGDQNAVGMLVLVRQNAMKGVSRARRAYDAAMAYARGQKVPTAKVSGKVAGEQPLRAMKHTAKQTYDAPGYLRVVRTAPFAPSVPAAELLSRGPTIGRDMLSLIGSTFGSEPEKKAYEYGVMGPRKGVHMALSRSKPAYRRALMTGHIVGLAQRIQAARAGNIAAISRKAAWELY